MNNRKNTILIVPLIIFSFIFFNCSKNSTDNDSDIEFEPNKKLNEFIVWAESEHSELRLSVEDDWNFEKEDFSDRTEWTFYNFTNISWRIKILKYTEIQEPLQFKLFNTEGMILWLEAAQDHNGDFMELFYRSSG
jgi:hypothetical protein